MERQFTIQVDLIGKLVKLDNNIIRKVRKSTVTIFNKIKMTCFNSLFIRKDSNMMTSILLSHIPVLDMFKLRRLHVGSNQSRLRHVIDHVTFEFLQEP